MMKSSLVCMVLVLLAFSTGSALADKGDKTGGGKGGGGKALATLDATEASHLTFMREEEKLARDVYTTFVTLYPKQRVFNRIATRSEQTHTDTMRDKLDQFNLPDPNPETNNLPSSLGVFTGDEWG